MTQNHDTLWQRYQQFRRLEDREQLVIAYQHLVARFSPTTPQTGWYDTDDITQAGIIGLCEAVERYQPDSAASFETYAALRIRGSINDALRHNDWATRRTRQHANTIATYIDHHIATTNTRPTLTQISENTGLNAATVKEVVALTHQHTHGPQLFDETHTLNAPEEPDDDIRWRMAIRGLPEEEKTVITLHYLEALAINDVALAMNKGQVSVYAIKKRALERLKTVLSQPAA